MCLNEHIDGVFMLKTSHHLIHLETKGSLQFIDLTDRVAEIVKESGICQGLVNIQTRHTTTARYVSWEFLEGGVKR